MGTKANMPGDEFWLMGFQFMSSEQAIVIRSAECEEGKEVARCVKPRRASANRGADRSLSSVPPGTVLTLNESTESTQ